MKYNWIIIGVLLLNFVPILEFNETILFQKNRILKSNRSFENTNLSINSRSQPFIPDIRDLSSREEKIDDPTGMTSGYSINTNSNSVFELIRSRSQFSRHFYNQTSGKYRYQSDNLVYKTGVINGTSWLTSKEYPYRFLIRHTNEKILYSKSPNEAKTYLANISLGEIAFVGVESFSGLMGFSLDLDGSGDGEYQYWPRLSNGKLPNIRSSMYALYPHLYMKVAQYWQDQILTDRMLTKEQLKDPRQSLEFFSSDSEYGIYYSLFSLNVSGSFWNVKHGFKYKTSDQRFHMITELECLNHNFDDLGLTYDIVNINQNSVKYEPVNFRLSNYTESIVLDNSEWEADMYLPSYIPEISLITQENQEFQFTFSDMGLAGFSIPELRRQKIELPNKTNTIALCAGMKGFGTYTAGTTIYIDPDISAFSTENYDLYRENLTPKTSTTYSYVGDKSYKMCSNFIAFNTSITHNISSISNVEFQLYSEASSFDTSSEGASMYIYNIGGNADSNTAKEDSTSYSLGTYAYESLVYSGNIGSGGYKTANIAKLGNLLTYWAENRLENETWISFSLSPHGPEINDYYKFSESQHSDSNRHPKLSFDYDPRTITISGYIFDNDTSSAISGAMVELFDGITKINGSTTNESGYYLFSVNDSNDIHNLWVWHHRYVKNNQTVTPSANLAVNFSITPEVVPIQSKPFGCKNPTNYTNSNTTAWTNETAAYHLGSNYSVCHTWNKNIYYDDYGWDVPSGVSISGVYIYLHWKSVLNDRLRIWLYWNGGTSQSYTLNSTSDWELICLNFSAITNWNSTKVNGLKVRLLSLPVASEDKVILDWVGTLVEYVDIEAFSCYTYDPQGIKGGNRSIDILFSNYGTLNASSFCYKLKLESLNYTDYHTWINHTYSGGSLNAGSSVWLNISIPMAFEGTNDSLGQYWDGWFALNRGVYNITDIFTSGDSWGYVISQPYFGEFDVSLLSIHHVLVAAIVYDDLNTSTIAESFDTMESFDELMVYENDSWEETSFSDYFATNFHIHIIRSSRDTSGYNESSFGSWVDNEGRVVLGLNKDWTDDGGTDEDNHGFDMLGIFVYSLNSSGTVGKASNNWISIQFSHLDNPRVYLHEILHTYMEMYPSGKNDTEHLKYNNDWIEENVYPSPYFWNGDEWIWKPLYNISGHLGGYIMGGDPTWYLHPLTQYYSLNNVTKYDGV